jgi:hypothetical protein
VFAPFWITFLRCYFVAFNILQPGYFVKPVLKKIGSVCLIKHVIPGQSALTLHKFLSSGMVDMPENGAFSGQMLDNYQYTNGVFQKPQDSDIYSFSDWCRVSRSNGSINTNTV